MDEELFELCKEVHKRLPEWEMSDNYYFFAWTTRGHIQVSVLDKTIKSKDSRDVPLYTSDYLLEKLPNPSVHKLGEDWRAFCGEKDTVATEISNTPLKALLKLAIALHDSGEL